MSLRHVVFRFAPGLVALASIGLFAPACGGFDGFELQQEFADSDPIALAEIPAPIDSVDGTCADDRKLCSMQCVSLADPGTGCDGACGACKLRDAVAACKDGGCAIAACSAGFADCNRVAADGCEVDKASTHDHCGACGRACGVKRVCSEGSCEDACRAGKTVCNGGCVDLASDRRHCGGCGVTCGDHQDCVGGVCTQPTTCPWNFGADGTAQSGITSGQLTASGKGTEGSAAGGGLDLVDGEAFDLSASAMHVDLGAMAYIQSTCGMAVWQTSARSGEDGWIFAVGNDASPKTAKAPFALGVDPRLRIRRAAGVTTFSVELGAKTVVSASTPKCEGLSGFSVGGAGLGKWNVALDGFRYEGICTDDFSRSE